MLGFHNKKEGKPKICISENINSRLTKDSTTIYIKRLFKYYISIIGLGKLADDTG